jgi:hypothetical protein
LTKVSIACLGHEPLEDPVEVVVQEARRRLAEALADSWRAFAPVGWAL